MGKTIHDPKIRYSAQGEKLYGYWKRIRRKVYSPVFEQFEVFYNWAMTNGYTDGARLSRFDTNGPYSPGNCFWISEEGAEATNKKREPSGTLMRKWDDTVNRIRLHYGMEPIHSVEV